MMFAVKYGAIYEIIVLVFVKECFGKVVSNSNNNVSTMEFLYTPFTLPGNCGIESEFGTLLS